MEDGVAIEREKTSATVARYVGISAIFIGAIELVPLLLLPFDPSDQIYSPYLIFPGLGSMAVGYLIYFVLSKGMPLRQLNRREAAGCTLIIWIYAVVIYALPLVLAGLLTFSQGVFEATSGLTTTGLSIMDVETCPRIFLLHRSLMHYFGGVGLVLVMTSVVSYNGGLKVYNVEGHTDRLLPNTVGTARAILIMYTGIIAAGVVAYNLAGMPLFDAFNMSISAVSTGGFAVHSTSIGYYDSGTIEVISVVLMLAGATNFLLNFMLLRGKLRGFFTHIETGLFYGIIIVSSAIVSVMLFANGHADSFSQAVREGAFQVVSVITTTGFQTIPSFAALGPSTVFVLIALMFCGSEAGSTAGGIKIFRIAVAAKGLFWAFEKRYGHRRRVYGRKINRFGKYVPCSEDEVSESVSFIVVYVMLFVVGSFLFTLAGASLEDALFEFASCFGNVGVSIGFITAQSNDFVLWVGSIGMLLGRLEIIPVFLGVHWLFVLAKERLHHGA